MDRMTFFKRVAVLVGACALKAVPAAARRKEQVEIQRSPVAGFQYGEGEEVWRELPVGAPLALVREPGNPHDERAVRVQWRGR
ncbi:MAG: HIRAN protein, partial [bacterium]|nr:HIRAN protein [bacterium]